MSSDSQMEFWGVEVKPGQSLKVTPFTESEIYDSTYIHLSQAALGEAKKDKGSEPVVLYVTFGGQKLVLGTLSKDNVPQLSFDLVLEKEFELSHNWKNGSIFFLGYKAHVKDGPEDIYSEDESEDEDLPLPIKENGKPVEKTEEAKPAASGSVQKASVPQKQVKVVDPKKDQEEDSEEDEDDDDEDESGSSDEDMMEADSDSDEDSDEDEEETPPAKSNQEKKRPNDSASKTPVAAKKAKSSTPPKTDGKKGGHTATPHPMKKGGKTPNSDSKDRTPKSGGQVSCKSCSKTFTSEAGLQQHAKAKHGGQ